MKTVSNRPLLFILLIVFILGSCQKKARSQSNNGMNISESQVKSSIKAPDFPGGMEWLNTNHPISLKDLRGKIVLLDFWTYCCINCMHVFPDLKKLEEEYPKELVIIGVHSAKFTTEQETNNIREAILRYNLTHPVVNDKNLKVWHEYRANAWPTFILINPNGHIIGKTTGEGIYSVIKPYIEKTIEVFDKEGKLDRSPVNFELEKTKTPESLLSFPGKVLADAKSDRLFISDSNHNRIVVTDLDGNVEYIIGSGEPGLKNGSFSDATFKQPQGMALDGNILYVADTENHAIRKVNLQEKTVTTLVGTGKQARQYNKSGTGTSVALNSPWDLLMKDDMLYVAMAGTHEIWKVNPKTAYAEPFAGTGQENIKDGPRDQALFAQPSGLATDGTYLYSADSEVSGIRQIGMGPNGKVNTIVGKGLFQYGDVDGAGDKVRLQHPLGVTSWKDKLLVADTYNNKIKLIDPDRRSSETWAGNGKGVYKDGSAGKASFNEPGGLSIANNTLYVADTNNNLIRTVNLKTKEVGTLMLKQIQNLKMETETSSPEKVVTLDTQTISSNGGTFKVSLKVPDPYHFNEQAPNKIIASGKNISIDGQQQKVYDGADFPKSITVKATGVHPELHLDVYAYYCENGADALCLFKTLRYKILLKTQTGGQKMVTLTQNLPINSN